MFTVQQIYFPHCEKHNRPVVYNIFTIIVYLQKLEIICPAQ